MVNRGHRKGAKSEMNWDEFELSRLINHFNQCNRVEGKSEKTITWYQERLNGFCYFLGLRQILPELGNLTLENARCFISYEQNRKLSPFTVQGSARALKAFSSWLFREQFIESNFLAQLKIPKAPVKVIKPLDDEEVNKLVSIQNPMTPLGSRNLAILLTFLGTGIRESELCDLRLDQTNLDNGYFKVMGKGNKERIVPMGSLVQKVLWKYYFHFRPNPVNERNDYMFLTLEGSQIKPNAIRLLFKRWGKKAGVPRLHAHLCRHTFTTNYLIHNCGDVFRLQQILGHTTLEMVRKYVHFASGISLMQGSVVSPLDRMSLKSTRLTTFSKKAV